MRSPKDDHLYAEVHELYAACYSRLVAVVGAVVGDQQEGEEAVQEAFIRLLGAWGDVGGYEDPESWVRKVALRVASNRRRKLRNGLRAVVRQGLAATVVDGPSGDAVDLERAMRQLSHGQRQVLVLAHVVGLDLESIARELGVPLGTVKSRLSRGRAALIPLLRGEVDGHV